MEQGYRSDITSLCRETAKSFDMARNGTRWRCEVTGVEISGRGMKKYSFYVYDKNNGREFEVEAKIENEETAQWNVSEVG